MIKAEELRIGNLLELGSEILTVISIQGAGGWTEKFGAEGDDVFPSEEEYDKIEGIALTEKWLKRLGFDTVDYEYDFIEWAKEETELDFSINQIGIPPENQPFIFTYDTGMGDRNREVQYVHQLQNLYFALTGSELIDLSKTHPFSPVPPPSSPHPDAQ